LFFVGFNDHPAFLSSCTRRVTEGSARPVIFPSLERDIEPSYQISESSKDIFWLRGSFREVSDLLSKVFARLCRMATLLISENKYISKDLQLSSNAQLMGLEDVFDGPC
jgi:hypothetical protein